MKACKRVVRGSKVEQLIQVSYDISNPKTLRRETNALLKGVQKFNCHNLLLINISSEQTLQTGGETIQILPATKWLL